MKKRSGEPSVTIWINILLVLAGNLGGLLGWLSGVLEPQSWALVSGILTSLAAATTIVRHTLKGGHADDPLTTPKKRIRKS